MDKLLYTFYNVKAHYPKITFPARHVRISGNYNLKVLGRHQVEAGCKKATLHFACHAENTVNINLFFSGPGVTDFGMQRIRIPKPNLPLGHSSVFQPWQL